MLICRMPEPEVVDDVEVLNHNVVVEGDARAHAQRIRAQIINNYFN